MWQNRRQNCRPFSAGFAVSLKWIVTRDSLRGRGSFRDARLRTKSHLLYPLMFAAIWRGLRCRKRGPLQLEPEARKNEYIDDSSAIGRINENPPGVSRLVTPHAIGHVVGLNSSFGIGITRGRAKVEGGGRPIADESAISSSSICSCLRFSTGFV